MNKKILFILFVTCIFSACRNSTASQQKNAEQLTSVQEQMQSEGWVFKTPKGGALNEKMGVKPIYGIQDNYFDITVGEGYNVALKIMNASTDQCIRYVYVPENKTITANEIPQGHYYLKLAYGQDWMKLSTDSIIWGSFSRNVFYEKSKETFDFGKKNSMSMINYELKINVSEEEGGNNFETITISEEEFNQ